MCVGVISRPSPELVVLDHSNQCRLQLEVVGVDSGHPLLPQVGLNHWPREVSDRPGIRVDWLYLLVLLDHFRFFIESIWYLCKKWVNVLVMGLGWYNVIRIIVKWLNVLEWLLVMVVLWNDGLTL